MVVPSPSTVCLPSVKASPGAGAAVSVIALGPTAQEREAVMAADLCGRLVSQLASSRTFRIAGRGELWRKDDRWRGRLEAHTSDISSLMQISYAVYSLNKTIKSLSHLISTCFLSIIILRYTISITK